MNEWPDNLEEAAAIQERLRAQLRIGDDFGVLRTVAGVDAGFEEAGRVARAAVVRLDFPSLQVRDYAIARRPLTFPYVPGFLSFREAPAIMDAIRRLAAPPDLIICDGQGIAHPRRLGIAAHIGLLLDIPSIGCAKSRLIGSHPPLPAERGAAVPLFDGDEQIGLVLRSRAGTKPVYVSPGHRVGMQSAVDLVMACVTRYRLPETTRAAHRLASHGIMPTEG
jgi:deoxyribonuclease V